MAISIFIIAVLSYALSLPDICGLVSAKIFDDPIPAGRRGDYFSLYRRHKWAGVGYALVADVIRALITVLIGGILLKGAGFPSVGKLLALLFALIGQAMPLFPEDQRFVPKQDLIYPALTLLFVDWRLFLVCVALAVLILALTGSRGFMAGAAAIAMPLFSMIFGEWWLKVLLALFCAIALIYCFWDEILDAFSGKGPKKARKHTEDSGDNGSGTDEGK